MVRDLIRSAKEHLAKAGYSEVDAEILFAHLLGINRMELHNPIALENAMENVGDIAEDFHQLLNRRLSHEPLQYITGEAHFRDLTLEVGPGVLVPRPESELMVSYLLALIEQKEGLISVIDLGAGSGALSIALSTECDRVRAIAVEKSTEALIWLRKNVAKYVEEMRVVEGDVKDVLLRIQRASIGALLEVGTVATVLGGNHLSGLGIGTYLAGKVEEFQCRLQIERGRIERVLVRR